VFQRLLIIAELPVCLCQPVVPIRAVRFLLQALQGDTMRLFCMLTRLLLVTLLPVAVGKRQVG
jgi:hypothetical protein